MLLDHVRDLVCPPVCLSLLYSIVIFDAFFFIYDHYHEQSIPYKFHPNRLNNYLYACWVILHAFTLSTVSFILRFL